MLFYVACEPKNPNEVRVVARSFYDGIVGYLSKNGKIEKFKKEKSLFNSERFAIQVIKKHFKVKPHADVCFNRHLRTFEVIDPNEPDKREHRDPMAAHS